MIKGQRTEDSIVLHEDGTKMTIKKQLEKLGARSIEDRYMVIGYGSNANPAQLQVKFQNTDSTFPIFKGQLKDYDVVYASFVAPYGTIPATIENSKGALVEVWANLLDENQIKLMDKTEGRGKSYWLAELEGELVLENGEHFSPIYSYVATTGTLFVEGEQVRLQEINAANTKFKGLTEIEVLKIILKEFAKYDKPMSFDDFCKNIQTDTSFLKQINHFLKNNHSVAHALKCKIIEEPQYPPVKFLNMKRHS